MTNLTTYIMQYTGIEDRATAHVVGMLLIIQGVMFAFMVAALLMIMSKFDTAVFRLTEVMQNYQPVPFIFPENLTVVP